MSQIDISTNDYYPLPRSQIVPQCPPLNSRCLLESPSSCRWPAACLEVRRGRGASTRSSPGGCQWLSFLLAFTRVSIVSLMVPISNRKGVQGEEERGERYGWRELFEPTLNNTPHRVFSRTFCRRLGFNTGFGWGFLSPPWPPPRCLRPRALWAGLSLWSLSVAPPGHLTSLHSSFSRWYGLFCTLAILLLSVLLLLPLLPTRFKTLRTTPRKSDRNDRLDLG